MKKLLILLVLLLFLPLVASAEIHTVENDKLILAIDTETLDFTLTDKATGGVFSSHAETSTMPDRSSWKGFMSSTLSIDVAETSKTATKRYDMMTAETTLEVTTLPDGVDATVDFTAIGIRVGLEIRLEDDSISITMPGDSIYEYPASLGFKKNKNAKEGEPDKIEEFTDNGVTGVYLAPCFGATTLTEKAGYMFVPEAAGAIINLTDGRGIGQTPYSKKFYGTNVGVERTILAKLNKESEKVTMPIFGMAYTDEKLGFLAVVENGAESADILAYPGGVITDYNWITAHFLVRDQYVMQTSRTSGLNRREVKGYMRDMTIRYYILSGDQANYTGMAQRYRQLLEEEGKLVKRDTAYRPRIDFLGAEASRFLMWYTVVPMTSFDQALAILEECKEHGLTSPLVVYKGWQAGGMSLAYGTATTAIDGSVGNRGSLENLQTWVEENGGKFYLGQEGAMGNTTRTYDTREEVVRTVGQVEATVTTGMHLFPVMYYMTPYWSQNMINYHQDSYEDVGGLALFGMPNVLYSRYYNGETITRGDTMQAYYDVFKSLEDEDLALELPFVQYWDMTDVYLDLPMGTTSYSFLAAEVPFLPMVLSGYIPYYSTYNNSDANETRQMLKQVEYGAYPSYLITHEDVQALSNTNSSEYFSGTWNSIKENVYQRDAELRAYYAELEGAHMVAHEILKEKVVKTTWSNGTEVIVNYTEKPYTYEDTVVPAMDYTMLKGENTL